MANISPKDVKELKEMTGSGMMDCKRALEEADGDKEKAVKILREKGLAKAAKKAGRIAAEGVIKTKTVGDKGVIVEVNCETDFCAKSDKFTEFVETVADTILANDAKTVEELMECKSSGSELKLGELLTEKISTISENIKVRRFVKMEGTLIAYTHNGGRMGAIVKLDTDKPDNEEVLKCGMNVALQVTSMNPQYVAKEDVPEDVIQNEREVQTKLVEAEGKPANVAEKIVEGRLRKFYEDVCLLNQEYFIESSMTIAKYIQSVEKAQNASIKVAAFVRYERGEGIEKKEENFADEVAGMIK